MEDHFDPPRPFRWDLARPERLGGLLGGPVAPSYDGFLDDLLDASARVVALAGDCDLYFVGRSLESMVDLLGGLLLETSWAYRFQILHFSGRFHDPAYVRSRYPGATPAFRAYLAGLALHPAAIAGRPRDVAFIDVVRSGSTLGNLIGQLRDWSREDDSGWDAAARRIRIVGVTERGKSSPTTWRWQQQVPWVAASGIGPIKNVSVPVLMYRYLADEQAKVSLSFPPRRWGREEVTRPRRDAAALEALRLAAALYEQGKQKRTRAEFTARLAEHRAMRERWYRSLVMELKQ